MYFPVSELYTGCDIILYEVSWIQEGGWTGMGVPSDGQIGQDMRQTDHDDADMPDWDDDDLVAMQAEPMVRRVWRSLKSWSLTRVSNSMIVLSSPNQAYCLCLAIWELHSKYICRAFL